MVRLLLALAALIAWLSPAGASQGPSVVASIKPIHSLVAAVMGDVGEPYLLVRGGGSPHAYAMRPSDARALNKADVVFWVGASMETFLARPISVLAGNADAAPLALADGVALLAQRHGGIGDAHDHEGRSGPGEEGDTAHQADEDRDVDPLGTASGKDMHIWLDPANARAMVAAIAARLAVADPDRASIYEANAREFARRITALDRELAEVLKPVASKPYVVFHDAYQYIEARYGLRPVGSITASADRAPGAGRLSRIRARLEQTGALCVFAEPQFEPDLVATLVAGTTARAAVLDPLGADLPAGPDLYIDLMRTMAANLEACLQR